MKISGVGVDIVENKRLKKLINNKQFISRIFSQKEINFQKGLLPKKPYQKL